MIFVILVVNVVKYVCLVMYFVLDYWCLKILVFGVVFEVLSFVKIIFGGFLGVWNVKYMFNCINFFGWSVLGLDCM